MDLPDLLLHPHLDGSPRVYARRGSPEAQLFRAVRSGDLAAVQECLVGVNPNVLTNEDRSPLSIAVHKGYDAIARVLLEHGADPYFPLSWALQNPTSEYKSRLGEQSKPAVEAAIGAGQWAWFEEFLHALPDAVPVDTVTSWISSAVYRGLPSQQWVVARKALGPNGVKELSVLDAMAGALEGAKGVATPVGGYALLAKQEDPTGYLTTWERAIEGVCDGHEYNANSFKKSELQTLVNLWIHDSVEAGRPFNDLQEILVSWGTDALRKGRPWVIGAALKNPLRTHSWTPEEKTQWLKTAWDDSYPLTSAPVVDILKALRQQWGATAFHAAVRHWGAQRPDGGLWMSALPPSSSNSTLGRIQGVVARMEALLDSGVALAPSEQARWLSKLAQVPGASKSFFWEGEASTAFVKAALRAGLTADTPSEQGVGLLEFLRSAIDRRTDKSAWNDALALLRGSSLDISLPAPVSAERAPRIRF